MCCVEDYWLSSWARFSASLLFYTPFSVLFIFVSNLPVAYCVLVLTHLSSPLKDSLSGLKKHPMQWMGKPHHLNIGLASPGPAQSVHHLQKGKAFVAWSGSTQWSCNCMVLAVGGSPRFPDCRRLITLSAFAPRHTQWMLWKLASGQNNAWVFWSCRLPPFMPCVFLYFLKWTLSKDVVTFFRLIRENSWSRRCGLLFNDCVAASSASQVFIFRLNDPRLH